MTRSSYHRCSADRAGAPWGRPPRAALAAAVALAVASAGVAPAAAGAEARETRLPRIDVIGDVETTGSKTAGSAVVIDQETLEETQPVSTQDALKGVAGINVREEEGYGFIPNIGLRGLNPDRSGKVLILEDGVPAVPSLFINNAAYYSPRVERMQRIEVLKGASSLRYGPNTIGGTINYITRDPFDGNTLTLVGGSHGYRSVMLDSGGVSGDAFGGVSVLKSQGDGGRSNGFDLTDVMVKGGMALADNQLVSAKFSWYDNEINTSYVGLRPDEYRNDPTKNPAPNDYFITDRVAFDVNHEIDLGDRVRLNTLVYWNRLQRDYWRQDVVARSSAGTTFRECDGVQTCTGGRLRTFEMMGADSRLKVAHEAFGIRNDAEIGVRLHSETLDNKRINGHTPTARSGVLAAHDNQEADNIALYVENRFHLSDDIAITPGLRVEHYRQQLINRSPTDPAGHAEGDTRNTEIMPGVGATWQLIPEAQVFAGVYRGFAPARVASAISSDGVDQRLEAERSTNVELGVRGRTDRLYYEATAFRMDFANQITPQAESAGITQTNAGKTLHEGLELALGVELGAGFSVDGNLTWLPTARYNSTPLVGDDVNGNRLVYAPKTVANLSLNHRHGPWRSGVSAHHVSSQFTDAGNTREESADGRVGEIPAYTVFDLYGSYRLSSETRLFGTVRNLADEKYIAGRHPDGIFPGMERSIQVGLSTRF
jgi:Fe(3+) dicitrate transport protein